MYPVLKFLKRAARSRTPSVHSEPGVVTLPRDNQKRVCSVLDVGNLRCGTGGTCAALNRVLAAEVTGPRLFFMCDSPHASFKLLFLTEGF